MAVGDRCNGSCETDNSICGLKGTDECPFETKYLKFKLIEKKEKTEVWEISSKLHGFRLGVIKWYGSWRQYAFFPEPETVFNKECMEDISDFIIDLMTERGHD